MLKADLEKIAKLEKIPRQGMKEELVKRLMKRVRLAKIRDYYSKFSVKKKFDILEHKMVPLHRIMSREEIKELIKRYGLKSLKQLPKIFVTDSAMIAIGAGRGDVIEITRKSNTAGEIKYYRLVV